MKKHLLRARNVIFITSLSMLGCSLASNMDEMHDKTNHLADTSDKMAENVDKTQTTADATYKGLRSLDTGILRNGNDAMNCIRNSPYMAVKLTCANTYFYGFEFQGWQGIGTDNQAKLEYLKGLAVKEFFQLLKPFLGPSKGMLESIKPLNSNTLDVYSFAANLHAVYPDQKLQSQRARFVPMSVYSFILEGLRSYHNQPSLKPDDQSLSVYFTRFYKNEAITILQKRVTFMPFLAYAFFTGLDNKPDLSVLWNYIIAPDLGNLYYKAKSLFVRNADPYVGNAWIVDVNDYDVTQIDFYTKMIKAGLMTRQFLEEIGIDSVPDNGLKTTLGIRNIYNKLKITNSNPSSEANHLKEQMMETYKALAALLWVSKADFAKVDPQIYTIDLTDLR